MTAAHPPLALVSFLLLPACGTDRAVFHGDVGAAFVQAHGHIALQNASGSLVLGNAENDLHDSFGVGDTVTSPYARVEADIGRQRVKVSGFGFDQAGSGVLRNNYGNIPAGTQVATSMTFFDLSSSWSYDLIESDAIRLAPGVALNYYSLDVAARSASLGVFEQVDTDVVVPMPHVDAEYKLGSIVRLSADVGMIYANLRDAKGRYWDAEAMARITPSDYFELVVGYH
ncbi:MAG TPA: hypothetical protein VK348_06710, partial [Planctomycetota bacterium]|nr:hypothetical protein [Planctomycetota bacterium]